MDDKDKREMFELTGSKKFFYATIVTIVALFVGVLILLPQLQTRQILVFATTVKTPELLPFRTKTPTLSSENARRIVESKVAAYTATPSDRLPMKITVSPVYTVIYGDYPEGSTGLCKDGTYTFAENEQGACSHHGGVDLWWGGSPTYTPYPTYTSLPTSTPTRTPTKTYTPTITDTPTRTPTSPSAPILILIDIVAEATSSEGAEVFYVVDVIDDAPISSPICSPRSGSLFHLGETIVNCRVTDSSGLRDSGWFVVTVQDTTAPTIFAHDDIVTDAESESGSIVVYESPETSDIVDGRSVASCSPVSGSLFPVGQTSVLCAVYDRNGNYSSSTFTVNVLMPEPTEPPTEPPTVPP